jgi:hypothetical protein
LGTFDKLSHSISEKALRKNEVSLPKYGKLPPKYRFILNPCKDARFSTCPNCPGKTLFRKVLLFIHVQPIYPTTINKSCQYCPKCEILIVHQDELEQTLALTYQKHKPEIIGNEYLVLGTLEPSSWRKREKEPIEFGNVKEHVHDFIEYLEVKYIPAHWGPADEK